MNVYQRILRDADAPDNGGGNTPPQLNAFVQTLPPDLQAEKCLHNMDSPATLAKGYVHAQKMIGTKRLPVPDGTFTDQQWQEHYDATGRPKTAADYKVPAYEFKAGKDIKIDDAKFVPVKDALHKAGLNQRQADVVLTTYLESVDRDIQTARQVTTNKMAEAETALKTEWGENYQANLDLAKATVGKFGDESFMKYINEQGGNDPRLIRMLSKMGAAMIEDRSKGGNAGENMNLTDSTRATQEIGRLKGDADFMKALTTANHPGHRSAVQQWQNLHKAQNPSKQVED